MKWLMILAVTLALAESLNNDNSATQTNSNPLFNNGYNPSTQRMQDQMRSQQLNQQQQLRQDLEQQNQQLQRKLQQQRDQTFQQQQRVQSQQRANQNSFRCRACGDDDSGKTRSYQVNAIGTDSIDAPLQQSARSRWLIHGINQKA